MNTRNIIYLKLLSVVLIFLSCAVYLFKTSDLNSVNQYGFHYISLVLNDTASPSHILEYLTLNFVKLVFQVDLYNLHSFYEALNPLC